MQLSVPGFTRAEIEQHLGRVLASDAFRSSQRSKDFLRHVVNRVLDGNEDSIKERNIAVEVFNRGLDYNSSEDSFVRVKASEVRRRLAAYYASQPAQDTLRIELPLGTYVPQFVRISSQPTEEKAEPPVIQPRRGRGWMTVFLSIAAMAGVLVLAWQFRPAPSPLDDFWSPILKSPESLVIFLPVPTSYNEVRGPETKLFPDSTWEGVNPAGDHRFFALAPHRVGIGAAISAVRFAALCGRTGKSYSVKVGGDLSFADLRNHPAIISGAFSSRWAEEINNEYRFRIVEGGRIIDGQNTARQWHTTPGAYSGNPSEDYAIAGRLIDSKSGRPVIIAAGLSTFGTQAAAEFLTDASRLAELSRRTKRPLNQGSFQVLLHVKVIGNTPAPASIVDSYFW